MRASTLLLPIIVALLAPAQAQPPAAPGAPSFRTIELRGGGLVTVRYGTTRAVTVRQANPDRPIRAEGERLVIDRCSNRCPNGHRIHVEVVTPEVATLAVSDGGMLQVERGFPRRAAITAAVSSGGTIDMRSLEAASVTAAVSQGGRILTRADRALTASISNGGAVTYWGNPVLTSSVRHGGVVEEGRPADLATPIAQFDPTLPRLPRPRAPAPPRPPRTH